MNELNKDIYYLVHSTNKDPSKMKYLQIKNKELTHQYPGIYLSLITKQNYRNINIFPGKYKIIFSRKLLLQNNYHINLEDSNGNITKDNTYFPNQINDIYKKIGDLNEIIFHNNINMKYCCEIITKPSMNDMNEYMKYVDNNYNLPNNIMENLMKPNMKFLPNYIYANELNYTGKTNIVKSLKWSRIKAKMSNIDNIKKYNIKELNKKIMEVYEYYDKNRKNIKQEYMTEFYK
jgi:hypothetical protein